jgi:hypothetical protein
MLASHGISYTPAQVRAMSERDRQMMLTVAAERATEASRKRAAAVAAAERDAQLAKAKRARTRRR